MKTASVWTIVPNLLRTLLRKDVALKPKIILLAGLLYLISPIDFLPDAIIGLGWLDDLIIVPFLGWLSYRNLPQSVQNDVVPSAPDSKNKSLRIIVYLVALVVVLCLVAIMGDTAISFDDNGVRSTD
ncbi:YkvA family protein [Thalassospira sp.]|uniref:YkvA family protein n=1 Tax=Thalassospira sp. TaxID=1912094 RepID=UPI003AA881F7